MNDQLNFKLDTSNWFVEIRRNSKNFWYNELKLTPLELVSLPEFVISFDARLFETWNGNRKVTVDYYPKHSFFRLSLYKYSRNQFIIQSVSIFNQPEYNEIRNFAKSLTSTEFKTFPFHFQPNRALE